MFGRLSSLIDAVAVLDSPAERRKEKIEGEGKRRRRERVLAVEEEEEGEGEGEDEEEKEVEEGRVMEEGGLLEERLGEGVEEEGTLVGWKRDQSLASITSVSSLNSLSGIQLPPRRLSREEDHSSRGAFFSSTITTGAAAAVAAAAALSSSNTISPYNNNNNHHHHHHHHHHQQPKAPRKRISAEQTGTLQTLFESGVHFPNREMRERLARQLALTPRTIQVWFQNRRQACRNRLRSMERPVAGHRLPIRWMKPVVFHGHSELTGSPEFYHNHTHHHSNNTHPHLHHHLSSLASQLSPPPWGGPLPPIVIQDDRPESSSAIASWKPVIHPIALPPLRLPTVTRD